MIDNFNRYFDHTLLKPESTEDQIATVCREALTFNFCSVCVNGCNTSYVAEQLKNSEVKTCTVIGFPLGASSTATKVFETENACKSGSDEIDMVINVGRLKEKNYNYVENEIREIVTTAGKYGAIVKVILETCLLTDEEIVQACKLALNANAAFVKTSTGFAGGGATEKHVALMRDTVKDAMGVKASGGIRTLADAEKFIAAGASRIGASASVKIMKEAESQK